MLKFLTHKLRTQSIHDENNTVEKIDCHDSGTESDGDLNPEEEEVFHPEPDIELSMSSRHDTTSPTDTACSSESPAMLGQAHLSSLSYDQHSSEEELEVINGPSSVAAAEAAAAAEANLQLIQQRTITQSAASAASEASSVEQEEIFEESSSPKRASSTILENRKRSLAHSSDDEVRSLLEPVPAPPVNFRTSPPLEALKPNRSHMFRATTPLILTETSRGIESIRISCDSNNSNNGSNNTSCNNLLISNNGTNNCTSLLSSSAVTGLGIGLVGAVGSSLSSSSTANLTNFNNSHQHHQHHHHLHHHSHPVAHHHHHHNNNSSCTSSPSSALSMDVRSVSPPAKLFHCAMSPRRRPPRTHHAPQRLQRPHRPCLDFDKMQQLKARSVTSWRHNNEHTGELSVFCW